LATKSLVSTGSRRGFAASVTI